MKIQVSTLQKGSCKDHRIGNTITASVTTVVVVVVVVVVAAAAAAAVAVAAGSP